MASGLSRPADRLRDFQGNSTAGELDIAPQADIDSAEKAAPRSATGALDDPDGEEEYGARHQRDRAKQIPDIISVGAHDRSSMNPDVVGSQRAWLRRVHESKG